MNLFCGWAIWVRLPWQALLVLPGTPGATACPRSCPGASSQRALTHDEASPGLFSHFQREQVEAARHPPGSIGGGESLPAHNEG